VSRAATFGIAAVALLGVWGPAPAAAQASDGAEVDVSELTVEDVRTGLASGRFTALELTRSFLRRIERYEGRYNALISLNPAALEIAAELDAEYAASGPRGPLHGVPVVIKDNIDYAGLPTTAGWEGFSGALGGIDMVPDDDAAVVTRLRSAGAVVLGKTNLPDFARDGTRTRSSVAGRTLNPYDTTRTPGGSSGGTATAVNASFAVLGIGTETGGSIQNPASAQGLVGVKPTFGLVPLEGVVPINATYVDVVGPLARTVADAALALDVLAGPSEEDLATYAAVGHMPDSGYAAGLGTLSLEGKRFGLLGTGWRQEWLPLDSATERLYRDAVATARTLGAEVVEDPFRGTAFVELYEARPSVPSVRSYDLHVYLQGLGPGAAFHSVEEWERMTGRIFRPGREEEEREGLRERPAPARPSATEEGDAYQAWRRELRTLFRSTLEEHGLDALLFPQAAGPAPGLVEDPGRPDYEPNNWPEVPSNIVNDLGVPVVTLPYAYFADGMPFVLALVGDMWSEADLLAYAYALERMTRARRPPVLY
jgi:Asp-tRNA(Asn)/Glu-tRNA(Gln) amidotransferase A subunit family amidase